VCVPPVWVKFAGPALPTKVFAAWSDPPAARATAPAPTSRLPPRVPAPDRASVPGPVLASGPVPPRAPDRVRVAPESTAWRYVDLWYDASLVGDWLLGLPPEGGRSAALSAACVLAAVCLLCVIYLNRRIRAVEVL